MDKESKLYQRGRRLQRILYGENGKNWDIYYIIKIIEEWEKMQDLFRGDKNEKTIHKK